MQRCIAGLVSIAFLVLLSAPTGPPAFAAGSQASPSSPHAAPSSPTPLSPEARGDLAMARQQYLAAIDDYRQAPQDSPVIWNKMGMAYHHVFAIDEAKRDYQRALRLRPKYPQALNNLGAVYYAEKNYRKAEKYYRKALRLDPAAASVYSNLGTSYFAHKKVKRGIAAYQRAFALDPHVFEGNSVQLVPEPLPARDRAQQDYCLARLFAQSGHNRQAIDYLRKALDEGFANRKELLEDSTLASLRATPEFTRLMTEQKLR
jgi:tetratricopeptide (TPR) repeat protein